MALIFTLIIVAIMVAKLLRQKKNFDFMKLSLIVVMALFLPINLITLMLLMWLSAGGVFESKKMPLNLSVGEKRWNVMPWISGVVVVIAVIFGGFWGNWQLVVWVFY